MALSIPLVILAFALPLVSQTVGSQSGENQRPNAKLTAQVQNVYLQECRKYIELYSLDKSAQKNFLAAVNTKPMAKYYPEFNSCLAERFNPSEMAPYIKYMMIDYMTVDQLIELNQFLQTELAKKMLRIAYAYVENRPAGESYTENEQLELIQTFSMPFWKAHMEFSQKGLPRFSQKGDIFYRMLYDFESRCNQNQHPEKLE